MVAVDVADQESIWLLVIKNGNLILLSNQSPTGKQKYAEGQAFRVKLR